MNGNNGIQIDIEHLLSLVEERSILWDRRRCDYKNKQLTEAGWREVFCNLIDNFESYDEDFQTKMSKLIKGKWSNLRDSWIKHMKKRMLPDCKLTRNYTYHDQMLFLKNVYEFESSESYFVTVKEENFPGNGDDSTASEVEYFSEQDLELFLKERENSSFLTTSPTEPNMEELIKMANEKRHLSFFKGILPSIDNFNDNQTIAFQIGVLELIRSMKQKK